MVCTPSIPLNNPYSTPLYSLLYNSPLRSLDPSSYELAEGGVSKNRDPCFPVPMIRFPSLGGIEKRILRMNRESNEREHET